MTDFRRIQEGTFNQPWGKDPPPAPATASRGDRRAVRTAWKLWIDFRPYFTRHGDVVEVEIDLKGNIWRGLGRGDTEPTAAWNALQDCIRIWLGDISLLRAPWSFRQRRIRRRHDALRAGTPARRRSP
jgi:hypothetical protein